MHNQKIGKLGEDIAEKYLRERGFKVLDRNFYTKYGEIDIIARSIVQDVIHFIEVKTRTSALYGQPHSAVRFFKMNKARKASILYTQNSSDQYKSFSYDCISIILNDKLEVVSLKHFKNVVF